jgi:voltage-gated potassium channel Kch
MKHKSMNSGHSPLSHFKRLPRSGRIIGSRFATLIKVPVFFFLTIFVHSAVSIIAGVFYLLEYGHNPKLATYLDALFWAVATVTTVGYGDIVPVTDAGKILAILTMLFGSLCLVLYTAFFAGALITPELNQVESKVKEMDDEFKVFGQDLKTEDEIQREILKRIDKLETSLSKKKAD